MALDAIFSELGQATASVIAGIRSLLGSQINERRLQLLMKLRGSVIHGRAPDVYDSDEYTEYFDKYEVDPIHDLDLVLADCLRLKIFDGLLKVHSDPHAKIIAEAQAKGSLPKNLSRRTIIEDR
jgi:hypothetical protein